MGWVQKGGNAMASSSVTLEERRQNAIQAVERLLRLTTNHEEEDWTAVYRETLYALRAGRDEDAIALGATIEERSPKDRSGKFRLQPRWVVSENLAEDVRKTLTRLRTHLRWGDQRPPIILDEQDPEITSGGTRYDIWAAQRKRDPYETQHEQLRQILGPWLESHKRPAWLPICEAGDGPATASKFAGTPWLATGETWPACGSCQRPMDLFLQLNLAELPRELDGRFGSGLLQFFYCRHTGGDCRGEGFEPFADCQHVRIVRPDSSAGRAEVPAEAGFFAPTTIVGWNCIDDYPRGEELEELGLVFRFDHEGSNKWPGSSRMWFECLEIGLVSDRFPLNTDFDFLDRCNGSDKLAGWPCWIQGVEYPNCPRCGQRMQLVFQHTGDQLPFMFGDMGIGHITQCAEHHEVVAFGWACH
jgi:hypothetical protein